jgi:glutaconyl-CoA decarboxylase
MENEITAPKAGTVKEIKVKNKDSVNRGDILIIID